MKYIHQDITTVEGPAIILHGVNCQRQMASGVAKALITQWPHIREAYLAIPQTEMMLGNIDPVPVGEQLYVVNCWTQSDFGADGKVYADPSAIRTCLQRITKMCLETEICQIFSPRIGCGLGGLDWTQDVQPVFEEIEAQYPTLSITICNWT